MVMGCEVSKPQREVGSKRKKYFLLVQRSKKPSIRTGNRVLFFGVFEAERGYPRGFVCNLPINVENFQESRCPRASSLLPKDLPELAEELLVDAYYRYEKDVEIQVEILKRLTLIWKRTSDPLVELKKKRK